MKQNILDTCSYELWYKNTSTGLQNMILALLLQEIALCLLIISIHRKKACTILLLFPGNKIKLLVFPTSCRKPVGYIFFSECHNNIVSKGLKILKSLVVTFFSEH